MVLNVAESCYNLMYTFSLSYKRDFNLRTYGHGLKSLFILYVFSRNHKRDISIFGYMFVVLNFTLRL